MQQVALWDEYLRRRENRWRVWGGAAVLCLFFMVATPKIPHSPGHHIFADMRNFLGVPNTLNVLTSFPLLVIGVIGFVLCLHGHCFGISVKGEIWGWTFFYAGVVGLAFGSAYYHLKPDDARVIWERLPMMIAIASLFSTLVIERIDERLGLTCLFSLVLLVLGSIVYERTFNDLRLCMIFIFIPTIAIPTVAFMFPPKYTHSRLWYWASGIYLLAKFEAMADMKVYRKFEDCQGLLNKFWLVTKEGSVFWRRLHAHRIVHRAPLQKETTLTMNEQVSRGFLDIKHLSPSPLPACALVESPKNCNLTLNVDSANRFHVMGNTCYPGELVSPTCFMPAELPVRPDSKYCS